MLLLGICVFVAGFVIPEKKEKLQEEDKRLGEEQIRELLEEQMKDVKARVSDAVDETISYAVEKTERSMERITNEKIMAVNEYSDTVLEAIHKNHEEVVFMYDMLNDKHQNIKETAAAIEQTAKEAKKTVQEAAAPALERIEETKQGIFSGLSDGANGDTAVQENTAMQENTAVQGNTAMQGDTAMQESDSIREATASQDAAIQETAERNEEKPKKRTVRKQQKQSANMEEKTTEIPSVNLSFASAGEDGRNNNEKILALHKAGKSNMAIARELGLGIGEVKLVIDLFKGV